MADKRPRRIVRRAVMALAVVSLAAWLYCSSLLAASFLLGAGVFTSPAYGVLCDTVFAPLLWLDGDDGRIEWLFNMAGEAYWLGFTATH